MRHLDVDLTDPGVPAARSVVAFDTETSLIRPALLAPPLVCVTWARPGVDARIVHASDARAVVAGWLASADLIVGHNVAYDFAVVAEAFPDLRPAIFRAYDEDRVTDTQIRQQLLDVAGGCYRGNVSAKGRRVEYKYDLESLAKRCAGLELRKDEWRLSYGRFLDVPLAQWPAKARELQAEARERLAALEAAPLEDPTEHENAVSSLRSMVDGDPDRCTSYPLDDTRATLAVYLAQEKHAGWLADQYRQTRAAFALHLGSCWGLRTDGPGVEQLRAAIEAEKEEKEDDLLAAGLVRPDGTRDTKTAKRRMIEACAREGIPVIRTDAHFEGEGLTVEQRKAKGLKPRCKALDGTPLDDGHDDCAEHVCLDADACDRSGDELLGDYAERTTLGKQLSNDIPALEGGVLYPIHTRYGFAATGRTTSSKPNIQNQSKRPGFREAFVPRPGFLFAECDFPSLELYTLAQCCVSWLGESRLADALNRGLDPHLAMAASMLGLPYDEAKRALKDGAHPRHVDVKKARQLAKPANFGFPGGMGIPKFVVATRKGVIKEAKTPAEGRAAWESLGLDEARAKRLKDEWLEAWPEMERYFARIKALGPPYPERYEASVETLFTRRVRGRASFCAACNNGFQALGADCAKEAGWRIARAQYVGTASETWASRFPGVRSPLFGARAVAMVHDEYISEVRDDEHAHDAAFEQADLMREGANLYLPDVPIPASKMEPLLMRRWAKDAVATFDANGRLVPWTA